MSEVQSPHPIRDAAKAAFPYSAPMIAGFLFLGVAYGVYMKALGFDVLFPVFMAALIYAGSYNCLVNDRLSSDTNAPLTDCPEPRKRTRT